MKGRPRTPTPILRARGSWRADTKDRESEPQFLVGAPDKPRFLSKAASDEWDRIIEKLLIAGILTDIDRGALVCLCEAWAEVVASISALKKNPNGRNVICRKRFALAEYFKAAAQFGMTPSARSRVQVLETKDANQDKKARFFKAS